MVDHDVVRFDITVHDPHAVTVVQSLQKPSSHQSVALLPNLQFLTGRKEIGKQQAQVWFTVHHTGHFRSVEDTERNEGEKNTKDKCEG